MNGLCRICKIMNTILIAGGGIAGLSAAYYLVKKAKESDTPIKVIVTESENRWGGKIVTDRVAFGDKYFIVEGGPDTFLATKPYAVALCKELGLSDRLHGVNPIIRDTFIYHKQKLVKLPDGLAMMIPTNVRAMATTRLLSPFQKLRMGLDLVLPPRSLNGDETLGGFISRRLGRGVYENLIEPLMSGIYAGDGDQLSLAATFPYLRDLELKYGSLVKGVLAMKHGAGNSRKSAGGWRSAFLTPTTGLSEIVESLVNDLKQNSVELCLNTKITGITKNNSGYQVNLESGKNILADSVILATPAFVSGSLLNLLDPELAETLGSIPYVSTATVTLAYHEEDLPRALNGYGYVIPRKERQTALACTWTSTKFPHRAPRGYALLRVFIGRAGQDFPFNESQLRVIAREELQRTLGIAAEPVLTKVFLWENAMPQYNLGHKVLLSKIDEKVNTHKGLALAGNGFRGIGIPDCIHSGEFAAQKILSDL